MAKGKLVVKLRNIRRRSGESRSLATALENTVSESSPHQDIISNSPGNILFPFLIVTVSQNNATGNMTFL